MTSKLTKTEFAESLSFIFEECFRFSKMSFAQLRHDDRDDLLFDIPHPARRGQLIIGKAAARKLARLTHEALRLNRLQETVSYGTMRTLLKKEIVKRFLAERRPIDQKQIDRLVSFLGREARKKCASVTHLVPCHILFVQEPDELPVGPIVFRTRRSFRRRILPAVRAYDRGQDKKWASMLLAGALHYYRGFKWVAEVSVTDADEEESVEIAVEATRAALNALHIVFWRE